MTLSLENLQLPENVSAEDLQGIQSREIIQQHVCQEHQLPTLPGLATKLLALREKPGASTEDLCQIVELDPAVSTQIVRYARSPFFNYSGKVESIGEAVKRVLGFEFVLSMGLGMSVSRSFRLSSSGPIGGNEFWKRAIQSATLTQGLSTLLQSSVSVKPGIAYLCGLLHDFGYLVLNHQFRHEYEILSQFIQANPDQDRLALESQLLGVTHAELGFWLMQYWDMPQEILVVTQEHHNPHYNGKFAILTKLIIACDHILAQIKKGDEHPHQLPTQLMHELGITEGQLQEVVQRQIEATENLDQLANQLAA